jgi:hypothetical protein
MLHDERDVTLPKYDPVMTFGSSFLCLPMV